MMYNYPFFSFPTFRNYNYYSTSCANRLSSVQPKTDTHNSNFKPQNMFSYMPKNILEKKTNNYLTSSKQTSTNTLLNNKYIDKYDTNNSNLNCKTSQNNLDTNNKLSNNKEERDEIFKIFGINLYFDDILLISLIFFLYSEGVKDDYLFISLILLLLS